MEHTYKSGSLDHLGLVAGMYDKLGIGERLDALLDQDLEARNVSIGQACKALVAATVLEQERAPAHRNREYRVGRL